MAEANPLMTRRITAEILDAVSARRRALDAELAAHPDLSRLADRDRAFVRNMVATALRRLGQIDALLAPCLDRPLPKRARAVNAILRIGTAQLLFMETADHAAVSTAVELAREGGHHAHVKLVNAVLRRLSRDGPGWVGGHDAARLNTPTWLWESWADAYGEATCRRIAESPLTAAPLDISATRDPEAWAEKLDATVLPMGTLRRAGGGPVTQLPGFAEGTWWVQDWAARMVAGLLGEVRDKHVIDLCAAPGGKTAYLAAVGARVTAVDRSENRLRRLRDNLQRLHLEVDVIAADATVWRPDAPADAVLLDAPCSATGTIRRHPDIPWTKTAVDVAALADTQARLLASAAQMLRPGGVLVFATCSLQPEEGARQVTEFLEASGEFRLHAIEAGELEGVDAPLIQAGMFRSLPCYLHREGGMDGFFAARLVRR